MVWVGICVLEAGAAKKIKSLDGRRPRVLKFRANLYFHFMADKRLF